MRAQEFTEGYLNYSVNDDGVSVTVTGHVYNSYYASGTLDIPESVTAFWGTNYTVTAIGDSAFFFYSELVGDLVIPSSVTAIGDYAFYYCSGFTGTLTIPNSVATIGDFAFINCYGFSSLTIGNSVITIGESAFHYCSGFTGALTIPNSVVTIGNSAFGNCTGFAGSLTIGNSVTSIGEFAFNRCDGFSSVSISNSVVAIGNSAFYDCSGFTGTLTIPNSVVTIGNSAFSHCHGLTSVSISISVTEIEGEAFAYCDGIEQITVEFGNPVYDSRNNCNAIIETATNTLVIGCKNTLVPNTITTIGVSAFSGCGLTSVDLPASVTTIEAGAYSWCINITSVDIPYHVLFIGNGVFMGCSGIEQIIVDGSNPNYDSRDGCNAIIETASNILIQGCKNTIIPNTVTKIGDWAFFRCLELTTVEIPDSVLEIGNWAFMTCMNLTSVEIGNSVTIIGQYAFADCFNLTGDLIIPNSVTFIGDAAFSDCSGLNGNLVFGNSLTSIGASAFDGSTLTGPLSIPETVTEIGERAFYNCQGFTGNLVIPNSVSTIGRDAFSGCAGFNGTLTLSNALQEITLGVFSGCSGFVGTLTIPSSVTSIGINAFRGCNGFDSVVVLGVAPPEFSYYSFDYVFSMNHSVIVRCGSKEAYEATTWGAYFKAIEEDCNSYSISVENSTGGTANTSVNLGMMGEEVSISYVADLGYELGSITVRKADDDTQIVPCYNNSFVMPNFDVVVKAVFTNSTSVCENSNVAVSVYPNPTTGNFKIEAEGLQDIEVYNSIGQLVENRQADGDVFECDLSSHEAGIYLIRIETANGIATKRVVLTK